jgi:hypothetical protein
LGGQRTVLACTATWRSLHSSAARCDLAEIPQLRADGAVRLRYFTDPAMSTLAETDGLPTTNDQVDI